MNTLFLVGVITCFVGILADVITLLEKEIIVKYIFQVLCCVITAVGFIIMAIGAAIESKFSSTLISTFFAVFSILRALKNTFMIGVFSVTEGAIKHKPNTSKEGNNGK